MPRSLLIFALCLPLAVLIGFMLSDPLMGRNMMIVSASIFGLLIPLAINIHHRALIWSAGAFITVFFLPGQPQLWMLMVALSFTISILSRPLARVKEKPVWDKMVLASLLCFGAVVAFTAWRSGGIGLRVLGAETFGGRKYIYIMGAIIGFLALTLATIPRKNAWTDATVFCLGPVTAVMSNIAYTLGPAFYFLFLLFPVEMAVSQAQADYGLVAGGMKRVSGLSPAAIAFSMFCLMRWGVRGMFDLSKPWRLGLYVLAVFIGLFSGFRSSIGVSLVVATIQFFAEGLHRTRYSFMALTLAVITLGFLAGFAETLPLAAQRAVSFLPGIEVNATAEQDAKVSLDWRVDMWKVVSKDIPKYFWFGKGYAIDPTDLYLAEESFRRGFITSFDMFIRAGDYHSGPLSLIIPFGIFGVLTFLWFAAASIRVLWRNMRYGDADLRNINVFLFSFFVGRLIFFMTLFGGVETDLWVFASVVGVSLSINGGPRKPPEAPRLQVRQPTRQQRELMSA